jgi:hypothetical protein
MNASSEKADEAHNDYLVAMATFERVGKSNANAGLQTEQRNPLPASIPLEEVREMNTVARRTFARLGRSAP